MLRRIGILLLALGQLSGCVVVPEFEIAEKIDFNYLPPNQAPLSYDDLLCCYRCDA